MPRQKKYTDRSAIVRDIDAAVRKRNRLRQQSEEHDQSAEFYRQNDNELDFKKEKALADSLLKKAGRLDNTRLKKLSHMLAEFDTIPLGEKTSTEGLNQQQVVLPPVSAILR